MPPESKTDAKDTSLRAPWRKVSIKEQLALAGAFKAAVVANDIEAVKKLLERGAHPDSGNALPHAAIKGYKEIVRLQIAYGSNVNMWDPDDYTTPLMHALLGDTQDHMEIARMLIESGADVKAEAFGFFFGEKVTALDYALTKTAPGHKEIWRLLLEKGADPERMDPFGNTPLTYKATWSEGDPDTVRLLLDHGAKVNAPDFHGQTALMHAAARGAMDIAQLLLDRGADITLRDKEGRTALDIAKLQHQRKMVSLLEEHAARHKQQRLNGPAHPRRPQL